MTENSKQETLKKRIRELERMLDDKNRAIHWEVLDLLAQAWEKNGPPGIVENRDLVRTLKLSAGAASRTLEILESLGITDHDAMGFSSYLTPEGYQIAQKRDQSRPLDVQIHDIRKED